MPHALTEAFSSSCFLGSEALRTCALTTMSCGFICFICQLAMYVPSTGRVFPVALCHIRDFRETCLPLPSQKASRLHLHVERIRLLDHRLASVLEHGGIHTGHEHAGPPCECGVAVPSVEQLPRTERQLPVANKQRPHDLTRNLSGPRGSRPPDAE